MALKKTIKYVFLHTSWVFIIIL